MQRTFCSLLMGLVSSAALATSPLTWDPQSQAFWYEGPVWLVPEAARVALEQASDEERPGAIEAWLDVDPVPETEVNELREGIERRRRLVESEFLSFIDERARLLFVHGEPRLRQRIDCGAAYHPVEIWRYGAHSLLLYQERDDAPFKLWIPAQGKRALLTQEMTYWLEEWAQLRKFLSGKRIDRRICPDSEIIDEVTGIDGLYGIENPPFDRDLLAFFEPPADLAAWASAAMETRAPEKAPQLVIDDIELSYPRRSGLRLEARATVVLSPDSPIEVFDGAGDEKMRFTIEGVIETETDLLEEFRVRFEIDPPDPGVPIALAFEHPLRPRSRFRIRMRVRDEVGGAEIVRTGIVDVPDQPDGSGLTPEEVGTPTARLADQMAKGADSLILLVPPREVVFGGLRVQAVTRGTTIDDVRFVVDGKPQLTKKNPPFTADLALPNLPRELIIRAEGLDAEGEVVLADEVVLNQPKGRLEVEILEPPRGERVTSGRFRAVAQVVVPEERRVEKVEFHLNNEVVATATVPPWQADLEVPSTPDGLVFMTVVAELDDGSRAEDVRFLASPHEMGAMDVRLVELYTTVLGKRGIVRGLEVEDFEIAEDGRRQEISRFELVENLPLTIGVTLDVSGSMVGSLGAAQRAAADFLDSIVGSKDQCFAVAFASEPRLAMHRTADPGAVAEAIEGLKAGGWTSLHDAVVFSLYYFRGVSNRRVLVILSDGDDTDSRLEFEHAYEYALGSGVVIYTIGLKNDALDKKAKSKLRKLADDTGGRWFFIEQASELAGIYAEIEEELRSQYLLAYASDRPERDGRFRSIEVEVKKSGLDARTIQGYIP